MGSIPLRRVRSWLAAFVGSVILVGGLGLAPAAHADDTFAPVPVAVSTTPDAIGSGGQATSRVTFQASGPITDVYVLFRNTATGKLHTTMTQGSYSAADSTYSFDVFFAQGTPPGTYLAQYMQIQTAAGHELGYWRDGSLIHNPATSPRPEPPLWPWTPWTSTT